MEKWLQQVEQMMLASMREVIRLGIEAYAQVNENEYTRQGVGTLTKALGRRLNGSPSVFS